LSTNITLHDTYFVVAHFHYVMAGGTLIAFVGALFHWWPKMFGRMYNETLGRLSALLVFVGFNVTFFSQFWLGTLGMPRRYATYDGSRGLPEGRELTAEIMAQYQDLHQVSTIGAFILASGLFLAAAALLGALIWGRRAPRNPWGGATLEWTCATPPIHQNFEDTPTV